MAGEKDEWSADLRFNKFAYTIVKYEITRKEKCKSLSKKLYKTMYWLNIHNGFHEQMPIFNYITSVLLIFCVSVNCSMQLFHCLRHEGTGGRTLLVDGFHAAEQVRQRHLKDFDLLSTVPLKHEYIENFGSSQNHMVGIGPVLNVYPWNKELYMIRWVSPVENRENYRSDFVYMLSSTLLCGNHQPHSSSCLKIYLKWN